MDTHNVIDMSFMFSNCLSINSLNDISFWDTSKVENINNIFFNCRSLINLPDVSKWKIPNLIDNNFDPSLQNNTSLSEILSVVDEFSKISANDDINNNVNLINLTNINDKDYFYRVRDEKENDYYENFYNY